MFMTDPQPNGGFEWTQAPWGRVLQCRPLQAAAHHLFTARDLPLRHDDDEWALVAAELGVATGDLLLVKQVHGATVAVADADRPHPWARPMADAIVSDAPDTAVGVRVADCVPVLLAEDTGRAVAAIHAGWRGMQRRTVHAGVAALMERFGVRPERLIAAIGPSIGPCCYEVGEDTRRAFHDAGHHADLIDRWFSARPAGKFHLDLWRATRDQLEGAGVPASRIHSANLCTKTHARAFHSYRADGEAAGRMLAAIRPAPPRR
jgi:purine-nucleoside/S-methyl-5'-thioadenosine phosphorylase / adenosine deaminase